jgi:hypothetical protein
MITRSDSRRVRTLLRMGVGVGIVLALLGTQSTSAQETSISLGTTSSFAVLAGTTVTNTGATTITGNVGVSPGTAVVGFPPGIVLGVINAADAVALQAQTDLVAAYNDAAGRTTTVTVTADLGGQTLLPGVYTGGALGLTGSLTLDAQGDPNAVFVFQAASTLITGSTSSINLINNANPCNIYWQVGSSATLGTNSSFIGTITALTSITAQTGAQVDGRLLARNGAVTLDNNTIALATCLTAVPPTTTTVPGATTTVPGATTTVAPIGTLPATGGRFATADVLGMTAIGVGSVLVLLAIRRRLSLNLRG